MHSGIEIGAIYEIRVITGSAVHIVGASALMKYVIAGATKHSGKTCIPIEDVIPCVSRHGVNSITRMKFVIAGAARH